MRQPNAWTRFKGTIARAVSDAAGDRRAEAKGDLEARTGREPEDAEVERAEQVVRQKHHDTTVRFNG